MVPILKMRRFSRLLRVSLPPEMGEMAQTFISEIEWLAALKCRATGLATSLILAHRMCSANLSELHCYQSIHAGELNIVKAHILK